MDKIYKSMMNRSKKYYCLAILLFILFGGCSSSREPGISADVDKLKSAPAEIELDGIVFTLDAYLWRDFMPSPDPDLKRGLIASIRIKSADGSAIPVSLKVTSLWVLSKTSVWESKPEALNLLSPDVLEVYASGGPEWDKGTKTDIVIEIRHGNKIKLLGIKNIEVHAVY